MRNMPHVVSVMTPFPHSVEERESVTAAKRLMYSHDIRHLPVTSGGQLVGILSDRDIKLALAVSGGVDEGDDMMVSEVCSYEAYAVEFDTPLDKVVATMAQKRIGSAMVTKGGKLVGIFTTVDVCRELEKLLHAQFPDA